MAQTRDLTYLGSPFGEGKGEAYILPKSDAPAYFLEYLKRGQDPKTPKPQNPKTPKPHKIELLKFFLLCWLIEFWGINMPIICFLYQSLATVSLIVMLRAIDVIDHIVSHRRLGLFFTCGLLFYPAPEAFADFSCF